MSAENEVKKCPFCGIKVDGDATNFVYHPRHEWCPFSHYTLDKGKWNRRATVSMETAQVLVAELNRQREISIQFGWPVASIDNAIAAFNREKEAQV